MALIRKPSEPVRSLEPVARLRQSTWEPAEFNGDAARLYSALEAAFDPANREEWIRALMTAHQAALF